MGCAIDNLVRRDGDVLYVSRRCIIYVSRGDSILLCFMAWQNHCFQRHSTIYLYDSILDT